MIVRALNSAHDWTFGKGQNNYLSGNAATVQLINTRLNSFLGDCFFDLGAGINWVNFIGSKNIVGLNLSIAAVILNTSDDQGNQLVQYINKLYVTLTSQRALSIAYNVQTVYSTSVSNTLTVTI